jgi:nitrogen fixation/metabolism regulation signal transduction histidine kinase
MKLANRILLINLAIFLVFLIPAGILFSNYERLHEESKDKIFQATDEFEKYLLLKNLDTSLVNIVQAEVLTLDPAYNDLYDAKLIERDEHLNFLLENEKSEKVKSQLHKVSDVNHKIQGTELLILSKVKEKNLVKTTKLFDDFYQDKRDESRQLIDNIIEDKKINLDMLNDIVDKEIKNQKIFSLIVILAALIIAVLLSLQLTKSLTKELTSLADTVDEVSQGNFDASFKEESNIDEIYSLSESLSRIMKTMKIAVVKMRKAKK